MLCRVLEVSRAAFYAWKAGQTGAGRQKRDALLVVHLKALHRQNRELYGSPRMIVALKEEGHGVGRRRVARLMREHDLKGTPVPRFRGSTADSKHTQPVAPNLLERHFTAEAPNAVWVGDITYLPTRKGWCYLAVLIDLFSRKIVGWALDTHLRADLCLAALRQAVALRNPGPGLIHHTDRGSQYASHDYRKALAQIGARPSMSRKGDCCDNACAESFFGTLEQELGARANWADPDAARRAVGEYLHHFYNPIRLHSTLGYQSPSRFEELYRKQNHQAA